MGESRQRELRRGFQPDSACWLTDRSPSRLSALLASHLTADNYSEVLEAARYKSKREVENQIAMLTPRPPVPSVVRKLPALKPTCLVAGAPSANAVTTPVSIGAATKLTPMPYQRGTTLVIAPLAPDRYKFQVTITRETHDKLRKIQDLLRHAVPNGDPAVILDRALTCLLQDLEKRRGVQAARPRGEPPCNARGRHVPAAVRREVWARDEGHCAFVGVDGRCAERGFLEFHHVIPFADGGPTTVDNLQLRCRAHNAYEAREYFGPALFRERPIVYELGPALLCHIRSWTDRSASIRRK